MNKVLYIVDNLINIIVFVFLILMCLVGVYALYDAHHIYEKVEVPAEFKELNPNETDNKLSYEDLKDLNKDVIGWIILDDTRIDYPVVQYENNTYYLNRDYNGEYYSGGSIFLDYRNSNEFEDDYSILYGHNLYYKGMFSDIVNYDDTEYFNTHLSGTLYLKNGKYEIDILAYSVINAFNQVPYDLYFNKNKNNHKIIEYFKKSSKIFTKEKVNDTDKLLLLSTCSSTSSEERMILLTRLTNYKEYD